MIDTIIDKLYELDSVVQIDPVSSSDMFFVDVKPTHGNDPVTVLLDMNDLEANDTVFFIYETPKWEIPDKHIPLKTFLAFVLANQQNYQIAHCDSNFGQGFWVYDIEEPNEYEETATGKFRFVAKIHVSTELIDLFLKEADDTIDSLLSTYKSLVEFAENDDPSIDDAIPMPSNTQIYIDLRALGIIKNKSPDPLQDFIEKLKDLGLEDRI